jgi:hypothetical protein
LPFRLRKPSLVLFRTRHVEDKEEDDVAADDVEDQFVSLWLDHEDEAAAIDCSNNGEVVWRIVESKDCSKLPREIKM